MALDDTIWYALIIGFTHWLAKGYFVKIPEGCLMQIVVLGVLLLAFPGPLRGEWDSSEGKPLKCRKMMGKYMVASLATSNHGKSTWHLLARSGIFLLSIPFQYFDPSLQALHAQGRLFNTLTLTVQCDSMNDFSSTNFQTVRKNALETRKLHYQLTLPWAFRWWHLAHPSFIACQLYPTSCWGAWTAFVSLRLSTSAVVQLRADKLKQKSTA